MSSKVTLDLCFNDLLKILFLKPNNYFENPSNTSISKRISSSI